MSEWQSIKTAPRDGTLVLLAGGYLEDFNFRDDDPQEWRTGPVTARWTKDYPGGGYWLVTKYDSGVCEIEYQNPFWWMPVTLPTPENTE